MAIYLLNFKKSIHQISKIFDKLNLQLLENGKETEIQKKLVELKNENANLNKQIEELKKNQIPLNPVIHTPKGDTDPGKPEVPRGIGPPCWNKGESDEVESGLYMVFFNGVHDGVNGYPFDLARNRR